MFHAVQRATSTDGAVAGVRVGRSLMMPNTAVWFWRIGRVLVDTGPPNQWNQVKREIERAGGVDTVFASHHHEDHAGNGAQLQQQLGCKVLAAPSSIRYLQEGYPQEWYRTMVWGRPTPFTPDQMAEETAIDGGEGVGGVTLVRVWTPGHCPDHHVLFCPERKWLFAGDLFVSARPRLFRMEEDAHDQIASLERVLQLDFEHVFCSHKGELPNGRQLLQRRLAWLKSLRRAVTRAFADSDHTSTAGIDESALAKRLLGPEPPFARFTLLDFSQRNLVASLLRMPRYAHAAAARRTIGRPTTRDVIAPPPPADAKDSLGAMRLEFGEAMVRLVEPDEEDEAGLAAAAAAPGGGGAPAAPQRRRAEWVFGSADDVLPGVSRLLRPEEMAQPDDFVAAATRDDEGAALGSDGALGPLALDTASFSALDAAGSGPALIGGVRLTSARRLRAAEARRQDLAQLLPAQAELGQLPAETAAGADVPAEASQPLPDRSSERRIAPRRQQAVAAPSPSRAGDAVSSARPTLPGWQAVAAIAEERAASGFADDALTPIASDALAELALERSRSPNALRWAQAVPPRAPVATAGELLERSRQRGAGEASALFDAPRERVRFPGVVAAMDAMGLSPHPGGGAAASFGADGSLPPRRLTSAGDEGRPDGAAGSAGAGQSDGAGPAAPDARRDAGAGEEGDGGAALAASRGDGASAASGAATVAFERLAQSPLSPADLEAQSAVESAAMEARLTAALRAAGVDIPATSDSGQKPIRMEDVRAARASIQSAQRRRASPHAPPPPKRDCLPEQAGGAAAPDADGQAASDGGPGVGRVIAAVFGRPQGNLPVGWRPQRSTWEEAMAAGAGPSRSSGAGAALHEGNAEGGQLSAEEADLLADALEDKSFRAERQRALQRRRSHRAFVEQLEAKRLAEAEQWLLSPTRKPVAGLDAGTDGGTFDRLEAGANRAQRRQGEVASGGAATQRIGKGSGDERA
ncbi:hypothetical protein FNF29_02386 [Cafeteria roenbergensis]|uniref:Metallo-beta-lactamase domain-containing protein n=1 Tax=Cafeteria roenbergensis TaxID=33653 RepID=A0A5A8CP71_CAFRO|nr:hypothetical protein FNF29_02386 [Cafeteria roenbergensis]|eukprot:KAA0154509.1 hypothetical protein FNF29_02386 [Cafeteria roenbergensis]